MGKTQDKYKHKYKRYFFCNNFFLVNMAQDLKSKIVIISLLQNFFVMMIQDFKCKIIIIVIVGINNNKNSIFLGKIKFCLVSEHEDKMFQFAHKLLKHILHKGS